jgi:hypothetical protein
VDVERGRNVARHSARRLIDLWSCLSRAARSSDMSNPHVDLRPWAVLEL